MDSKHADLPFRPSTQSRIQLIVFALVVLLIALFVFLDSYQVQASNIVQPGGAQVKRGVFASAPSCTAAQFIYSATDAALQGFCDGASNLDWKYAGVTVTPTVVADLPSWYNQGGASTTTLPGSWILTGTTGASHNLHGRVKAVPATPYSIVSCQQGMASGVTFSGFGMIWDDGTKAIATEFTTAAAGAAPIISIEKFTNATTFSGSYVPGNTSGLSATGLVCLAMIDDGTNRAEKISFDGKNWTLLHTVGNTDFLTATQVGVYADQGGGGTLAPQTQIVSVVTLPSAL